MYCKKNFKTKKALIEAVKNGERLTVFAPGLGVPKENGIETLEGPHYPEAHSWYAQVEMTNGVITKVLK